MRFLLLLAALAAAHAETRVVMLGTGTPNADPQRSGPAVAIVVSGVPYLVDSGPGVVRRMAAAKLDLTKARVVFLTHLHSDHTLGLPDLMLSPWVLDRTAPLEIYGPRGIERMTRSILDAYREDIQIRLQGGEPSNKTGHRAAAHRVRAGVVFQDANVKVTAFRVPHGKWPEAYGYRFDTADRSIVISGDTVASDEVATACNGCDVLIHEVISAAGLAKRRPEWQRYHKAYHTPADELGAVATKARPGLLVLYHQLFSGVSEEALLAEVRAVYSGKVVSARDLDVY
jgi:ribonuclease Z